MLECDLHLSILKINFKQSHLWFNFEFVNFKLIFLNWIKYFNSQKEPFDLKTFELKENQLNELKWIHWLYPMWCWNSQFSILNWILPLQFFQFNSWFLILQRECDVMLMLLLLIKKIFFLFSFISLFFQFLYFFFTWVHFILLNSLNWQCDDIIRSSHSDDTYLDHVIWIIEKFSKYFTLFFMLFQVFKFNNKYLLIHCWVQLQKGPFLVPFKNC